MEVKAAVEAEAGHRNRQSCHHNHKMCYLINQLLFEVQADIIASILGCQHDQTQQIYNSQTTKCKNVMLIFALLEPIQLLPLRRYYRQYRRNHVCV